MYLKNYILYTRYGGSFQFSGDFKDTNTKLDNLKRKDRIVVGLDALNFYSEYSEYSQYSWLLISRELNKAFVGFYAAS